jgi:general secretion pathway protein G
MVQIIMIGKKNKGFTLLELVIVVFILSILAGLISPNILSRVADAREAVLKSNISGLRYSLDQFYNDTGSYPDSLNDLVTKKYIKQIPIDPITESNSTWKIIYDQKKTIIDIKSGATGSSSKGVPYENF